VLGKTLAMTSVKKLLSWLERTALPTRSLELSACDLTNLGTNQSYVSF
jgi:hypothetical protein